MAQPYVFSLFASKRELFLAAVERSFELRRPRRSQAAPASSTPARGRPRPDVLDGDGPAYVELLDDDRDVSCSSTRPTPPATRRSCATASARCYARARRARGRSSPAADPERIDEFFRYGMWLNVAAAMGVEDLSAGCEWMRSYR